ncbi:MAG: zinc ribbon domain-containing protein [Microthrixaceae bacterium]
MEFLMGLWLPSTLFCVAIAKEKGQSMLGGLLLGLFAGPLGVLITLLVKAEPTCPRCAEFVKREAKVCRHCGADLIGSSARPKV